MKIKKFQLENGLTVLLVERHKAPVVTLQMWVKTGSADEGKGEDGISHFIEHLLFKGTRKYKVGEVAHLVENSGGEINAYTSFDQTVYHITLSSEFLNIGMDILEEMICFPMFDEKEIDSEREVVLEEVKRSNDSPQSKASRLLFSTIYQKHPYSLPVIGSEKTIKKVSRKTLYSYFKERYVPGNMFLLVVGDVEVPALRKEVVRRFGGLAKKAARKVKRTSEPKQNRFRTKITEFPYELAQVHIAWPIPKAIHEDIPAIDLLSSILGQGESSRLVHRLRVENPLVQSCHCGTFTPKDPGLFAISFSCVEEKVEEALKIILEELMKILESEPSQEEMKRVITSFESEEFYGLETVGGLASKLGHFEFLTGNPDYFSKYIRQIYELRPHQVTQIARKYLVSDRMAVTAVVPRNQKNISLAIKRFHQTFKVERPNISKKRLKISGKIKVKKLKIQGGGSSKTKGIDSITFHKLDHGINLVLKPDHETAVTSLRLGAFGGLRAENKIHSGLTELFSRCWGCGTKSIQEPELYHRLESMAASLSAFGGRNTIGLSVDWLAPFQKEVVSLFADTLRNPSFSESVIEREKNLMIESIKAFEDNPSQVVMQNFMERMFGGHPYGRRLLGNPEALRSMTQETVEEVWKTHVCSKNIVISVVGNFDVDEILDSVIETTKDLPAGKRLESAHPCDSPKEDQRIFAQMKREQSHIFLGYRGLTITDPKRYILRVIYSILAGQGGRLFMELRDRASLAYSVSPFQLDGVDTGYFGTYIGCSPEKGGLAISMMKKELDKLMNEPVQEEELERAKRHLIGHHDIDLQTNRSFANAILFDEIYGLPYNDVYRFSEHIRGVTSKEIIDLSQQIFSKPSVLSAVGPHSPW